jgi:hypothetical protein
MDQINNSARAFPPSERKYRRFSLQYPVRLKVHDDDLIVEFAAMSRNISICGLLLETFAMIPQNTPVSFTVTVESCDLGHPIRFVGEGKVVRVASKAAAEGFAIAVECERPIKQIGQHLEATGS